MKTYGTVADKLLIVFQPSCPKDLNHYLALDLPNSIYLWH